LEFSEDGEGGFPAAWKDVALLANPITSTINAVRIHRNPDGTVEAEHLPDFLKSDDNWFRPVNIEFGPDGCLYVADFYNKIISHNEVTTDHPARDRDHGRIWRIRHESQPRRKIPNVAKASPAQLLQHLQAPILWEKRAAWQQIADRNLTDLAPALIKLAADEKADVITRIHALWSLEELRHFDRVLLDGLLASKNDSIRREAVRSLASFDLEPAEVASRLRGAIEDENCMIRSQAIRTLSDLNDGDPAVLALLITACKPALGGNSMGGSYERNHERFLARMALEKVSAELQGYLARSGDRHPAANVLWAIQALEEAPKQKAFLALWDKVSGREVDSETFVAIAGMLKNQDIYKAVTPTFQDAAKSEKILRLALANQSRVQSKELADLLTPTVARLLKSPDTLPLALGAVSKFKMVALSQQVAAISPAGASPETLRLLLSAQAVSPVLNAERFKDLAANKAQPFDLRLDATHALAVTDQEGASRFAKLLLDEGNAAQRTQVASVLSQSAQGGAVLCRLFKDKAIAIEAIDISAAERLFQANRRLPEAKAIFTSVTKRLAEQKKQAQDRIQHLMTYIAANPGDPAKGRATFTTCLTCHKVGTEGQDIAPPLDGSGHRDLEHLLTAIVDPDAAVEGGYGLYRITRTDGSVVEGLLEKEEPLGTTVAAMGGARIFVPLAEIKKSGFVGGRSFMPPTFGQLPEATMADLVAYIATLKEEQPPTQ
jgi:putative heme-binding domain-containing protein